ncbi:MULTISPECIES: hypothetical protein [unclassified Nocardioides]|uniref:hypothetical protein n=1 Tax=unclassified Nocardioides TaxID=2615069 RepID=UPI0012E38958|nr:MULTISPECIES: hypothetical protein [unclassified Nocardioides]
MTRRDRTVAKLERAARQLVADNTPAEEATAQLLLVSSDPIALGIAAGRALGRWETLPLFNPEDQQVAALLGNAGADKDTLQTSAEDTARRLRKYMKRG